MPRFVARPVVVDAYQSDGSLAHMPDHFRSAVLGAAPDGTLVVRTEDGERPLKYRDWIARGPDGEFFVMPDGKFDARFEPHNPVAKGKR